MHMLGERVYKADGEVGVCDGERVIRISTQTYRFHEGRGRTHAYLFIEGGGVVNKCLEGGGAQRFSKGCAHSFSGGGCR